MINTFIPQQAAMATRAKRPQDDAAASFDVPTTPTEETPSAPAEPTLPQPETPAESIAVNPTPPAPEVQKATPLPGTPRDGLKKRLSGFPELIPARAEGEQKLGELHRVTRELHYQLHPELEIEELMAKLGEEKDPAKMVEIQNRLAGLQGEPIKIAKVRAETIVREVADNYVQSLEKLLDVAESCFHKLVAEADSADQKFFADWNLGLRPRDEKNRVNTPLMKRLWKLQEQLQHFPESIKGYYHPNAGIWATLEPSLLCHIRDWFALGVGGMSKDDMRGTPNADPASAPRLDANHMVEHSRAANRHRDLLDRMSK